MSLPFATAPVVGLYQINWSTASIWYTDLNGNALSKSWSAAATDSIRCSDNFIERLSRPTGARYANTHHLDEQHIIEIGGYMDLSFIMQRNQEFVFYLTWQSSDQGTSGGPYADAVIEYWARTYYGVTFINLDNGARASDVFSMTQRLRAQFYTTTTGVGTPPQNPVTA